MLDVLIQRAIRKSFPNTTLLVIAHRLNTVMDMDVIIGLEKGELKEVGSPADLAKDKKVLLSFHPHFSTIFHSQCCTA